MLFFKEYIKLYFFIDWAMLIPLHLMGESILLAINADHLLRE